MGELSTFQWMISFFCFWTLLVHLPQSSKQFLYVKRGLNFRAGQHLFQDWRLPALNHWQFLFFNLIFCVSLVMVGLHIYTRLFLFTGVVAYFFYFGQIRIMLNILRKTNMIPVFLFLFLVSPATTQSGLSNEWLTVFLLKFSVVQVYVSAGIQKLRFTGIKWADGKSLQHDLLHHYAWGDAKAAFLVAKNPNVTKGLAIFTLIFECSFFLILVFPALTYVYLIAGLIFHMGTSATMKIHYILYFLPAYLVFLLDELELLRDWLAF